MEKKTILTGIRPTGNLHFGHLFGAGKTWLELQDKYDFYLEIADVQALTDNFHNPSKVHLNVFELSTITFLLFHVPSQHSISHLYKHP